MGYVERELDYPRLKKALEAGSLGRVTLMGGTAAKDPKQPLDVAVRPRAAALEQDLATR